jgi:interferon-induced GTP-binding protein Mx1
MVKGPLGVLTKPDKIDPGTEADIMAMLRGDLYSLRWGYYIVRTPRQAELDEIENEESAGSAGAIEKVGR